MLYSREYESNSTLQINQTSNLSTPNRSLSKFLSSLLFLLVHIILETALFSKEDDIMTIPEVECLLKQNRIPNSVE